MLVGRFEDDLALMTSAAAYEEARKARELLERPAVPTRRKNRRVAIVVLRVGIGVGLLIGVLIALR